MSFDGFACRLAAILAALALTAAAAVGQILAHVDAYYDGDVQGANTIDGLNFSFASAVSPDGKHVYVCSGNGGLVSSDNALVVFSRNSGTGELTFVEAEFDDQDGGSADGLFSCRDVVVSPDGKHVYTAGFSENEIGLFTRDSMTGALSFVSVVQDGVGGVNGLAGVEALALSPDGSALFAVGSIDDALEAFSRDAMTGALTLEDEEFHGLGGVTGLDRPMDVTVSPDGKHVYTVAGGNENFTGSDAVAAFDWNGGAGALTFIDSYSEGEVQGANTIDGLHWASSLTVSPDGKHVYATGGMKTSPPVDPDWIAVFSRSPATGALTWLDSVDDFNFCDLDIRFQFETYGLVAPDSRFYVTSGRTALAVFDRDSTTGLLSFLNGRCDFDDLTLGINLPRKIAIDPVDLRHVYVPGNADNSVSAFRVCNPGLDGLDRVLPDQDVGTAETEIACRSLTAADYNVLTGGDVVFDAPRINLENGFDVIGVFTAVNP